MRNSRFVRPQWSVFPRSLHGAGDVLHFNYWQPESVFGQTPTRHGCVGRGYTDARFFWTFLQFGDWVVIRD